MLSSNIAVMLAIMVDVQFPLNKFFIWCIQFHSFTIILYIVFVKRLFSSSIDLGWLLNLQLVTTNTFLWWLDSKVTQFAHMPITLPAHSDC